VTYYIDTGNASSLNPDSLMGERASLLVLVE